MILDHAPGIGSYGDGMTGAGLALKVQEAYGFIASNYVAGDEIALFGFSRGAYTVRMVSGIVGQIGILGRVALERFPELVVGAFDTVGSFGLPAEFHKTHPHVASMFGFSNLDLGPHVELALHALALNETRKDFQATLWKMTEAGRQKGQTLKQVWFSGSHSDIGGGWNAHDSADVALAWMVSETAHLLAFDIEYVE
ncbi:hypothetical protein RQP46_010381 [Phenoliferia psychrophenolica]